MRLDSVTPEIVTLRAELAIKNPYGSSARLKNISFDLALTDRFIAYGKRNASTEVKAGSVAILDVPLALQCKQVTEQDFASLFSPEIPYRLQGSAILEEPFGPRTLPIEIRNRIKAPDRLQIFLQDKTASAILSLDRFETRQFLSMIRNRKLKVRFNNPFSFPLIIHDFRYEVKLANQVVADGESESPLPLSPGQNRLELDIHTKPVNALEGLFKGFLDKQMPDMSLSSEFRIVRENRDLIVRLIYIPD